MRTIEEDRNDLTTGNLFRKLVLYTLPILLTSILSMLFTTVDVLTVSWFGGKSDSIAAIGTNNSTINLLIGLFLGLGVGANIVVANAKGIGDKVKAFRTTQSAIVLAFIAGVLIALVGWFIAEPVLRAIHCEESILPKAALYLRIYLAGSPIILIYNFGAAILRAYGDSRRPLYALLLSGVFNIGLNMLFVAGCHMDVLGVALGTILSQVVGAVAVIYFLKTDKHLFVNFSFKKLKIYPQETREILVLGLSAGLQSVVFNITNVIIQSSVNTFGKLATAGSAASNSIEGYQYLVLNSISTAAMSMIAQNNGARKKENVLKCLKYAMILEIIVPTIMGLFIFFLRRPLMQLFVSPDEVGFEQILEYGYARIMIISLTYFICGINECLSAYYRGLKYSFFPTIVTTVSIVGFRLLFIYTLFRMDYFHNLYWLFATYPFSWIICISIYLLFFKKKSKEAFDKYNEEYVYEKRTRDITYQEGSRRNVD